MKKWLLVFSLLLVGGISYFFTVTKNKATLSVLHKQVVSDTTPKTYRDIFHDNLQVNQLKLLQQQQDITELDRDSATLIAKADKLIEQEHLDINIQLTKEEQKKRKELKIELENKIAQLKELSNDY